MRRFTKGLVLLAAILAIGCMLAGCESARSAISSLAPSRSASASGEPSASSSPSPSPSLSPSPSPSVSPSPSPSLSPSPSAAATVCQQRPHPYSDHPAEQFPDSG